MTTPDASVQIKILKQLIYYKITNVDDPMHDQTVADRVVIQGRPESPIFSFPLYPQLGPGN